MTSDTVTTGKLNRARLLNEADEAAKVVLARLCMAAVSFQIEYGIYENELIQRRYKAIQDTIKSIEKSLLICRGIVESVEYENGSAKA